MTEVKKMQEKAEVPRTSTTYIGAAHRQTVKATGPDLKVFVMTNWRRAKIHTKKWANGIALIDPGRVNSNLASTRQLPLHDPQAHPYMGL